VALHFGDFAADLGSRQVWQGAQAVPLGPKAFELLELLLRSRPRALSKAQIRDCLWPRTVASESNLTTLVNELRTALGDRRLGYAFCGEATEVADVERPGSGRARRLRLFLEDRESALREEENLLGRLDEGVAWFESPTVSRRHARIVVAGGKATLEDLGSKNGTFLRGERISSPRPLADGDQIVLGRVHATFRVLPPLSTRTGVGE
jgi:FHA domain/Transcriptional regulatory protein, C terminal